MLVLGGTGFVGSQVVAMALAEGWEVVTVSRRGPPGRPEERLRCVTCDATLPGQLEKVVTEEGPFDAFVHCIGALFDGTSGYGRLNWIVSACGSVPEASSPSSLLPGVAHAAPTPTH
jgi:nucleoside-diphosphate-sugar epimerase